MRGSVLVLYIETSGSSGPVLYRDLIRGISTCIIQRHYQGVQYLCYIETLSGGSVPRDIISVPVLYRDIIIRLYRFSQYLCYIETLSGGHYQGVQYLCYRDIKSVGSVPVLYRDKRVFSLCDIERQIST